MTHPTMYAGSMVRRADYDGESESCRATLPAQLSVPLVRVERDGTHARDFLSVRDSRFPVHVVVLSVAESDANRAISRRI